MNVTDAVRIKRRIRNGALRLMTLALAFYLAFIAIAVLAYLVAVKKLAILPGSNADWLKMAKYEEQVKPGIQLTGYAPVEH